MVNEKGYEALNIRPDTKSAFDAIQENEPIRGNTQDATLQHLVIEAGYEDYLEDAGDG